MPVTPSARTFSRAGGAAAAVTAVLVWGCADAPSGPTPGVIRDAAAGPGAPTASRSEHAVDALAGGRRGAVYTLTNATDGNGVIAFRRAADGALTRIGTFATGGRGGAGNPIDPLVSQYAVVLDERHEALFAVDAGSNEVTSFRVHEDGSLARAGTVASGGERPISLAVHDGLLYVLNTTSNTLRGFRVAGNARLVPVPGAEARLPAGAAGAAAVRFTPDGRFLVVTERVSNRIDVFPVRANGRLGDPAVTPGSAGASFGFDVTRRNQPIVSETQGSLTSYTFVAGARGRVTGALVPVTPSIATGGRAACWVILTGDGRYAYTTNAGSDFVSGFGVDQAGRLTALTPGAPTGASGAGAAPIDLDQVGSRLLYVLEAGTGTIGAYAIDADGALSARPDTPAGPPASGLQGLAAY